MIDVHDVATRIIDASRSPIPGNVALQRAVRVTTEKLADCWDDCAAILVPNGRAIDNGNPYRLALELTPDGPHAPCVEGRAVFVDEPADGNGVDGVWVVWRTPGDRSQGFNTIYPQREELEALRQVNTQGFGHVEFIPFGVEIA